MHSMSYRPCPECGDLDGCHLPAAMEHNRLSLAQFWDALADWSQKTFGDDAVRGPRGPILHLKKECDEALASPGSLEEYADLLFLAFDATRRAGFSLEDLRRACCAKLKVNMARQWPAPTSDEPVEHVRGSAAKPEPCSACGESYTLADLVAGDVFCPTCRAARPT